MVSCPLEDLVCLHLDAHGDGADLTQAPHALTAAGVGDALEVDEDAVARIRLLDSLDSLVEEGLVEAGERAVESAREPRTVYELTDPGREQAAAVREDLAGETVVVADGAAGADGTGEVALSEVGEVVDDPAPMVTALARARLDRPLARPDDEPAFVGREASLGTVVDAIEASVDRGSRTVVVVGDAGMGKTALVREAADRVADDREDLVLATGACQAGATAPYAALRRAFQALPGGDALVERLADAGVSYDDPGAVEAQRTALFNDVADGLREAATERPLVLFVDNLQWGDEATLSLFGHLARSITEWLYPVAFVGAYRQPPVAAADGHPLVGVLDRIERAADYEDVRLEPLTRAETRTLVARTLGRHELPDAFVDAVHERTGGVPLLVVQTTGHLLEEGVVDPAAGEYPESGEAFGVPVEVIEQVDRRLGALDARSRELVQLAAVVGERVDRAVLAAASDLEPARRREYVDLLVDGRVFEHVEPRSRDGDLRFVSGLFREAVLEAVPADAAERYHERVAEALRSVHGDGLGGRASSVARHLERAGDVDGAVDYYRRAGEAAAARYAHEEAIEHYRRALEIGAIDTVPAATLAAVARELADVHATVGAFDRALETVEEGVSLAPPHAREAGELLGVRAEVESRRGALEEAEETASRMRAFADELGAAALEAEALRKLGNVARKRDAYERAERFDRGSLQIARDLDDDDGEARSLVNLGVVAFMRGDVEEARGHYREALALKRELGDHRGEARVLGNLGIIAMRAGDLAAARDHQEASLAAFREVGDRHGEARTLGNLGVVARRQNEFAAAREYYREAREVFRTVGDDHGQARVLGNLGNLAYRQADHETAEVHNRESLELKREVGDRGGAARTLNNLGNVLTEVGEFAEARECYRDSLAAFREIDDDTGRARSLKNLGRVAVMLGEFDAARDHLAAALATFREADNRAGEGYALKHLGRLAQETGDLATAAEQYEAALVAFEDGGEHHPAAKARHFLGVLAFERGDHDTARERLEASRATFEEIGDSQFAALSRGHFGLLALAEGDGEYGRSQLAAARATLRSAGAWPVFFRLLRRHCEFERAAGNDERARECCEEADRALERAGPRPGFQGQQLAAACEELSSGD